MQFNSKDKELTLKIVYYGPALSGKTTNIQALHHILDPSARGRLMTLDTKGDRTLFFDLLPVHFVTRSGFKVKIKLITVPGQVVHEATRRIVLAGTDAIVFIADGSRSQRASNNEAYSGMVRNLKANGLDPDRIPIVIQFNKMDLPGVLSAQELREYAARGKEPILAASAIRREGVVETLHACLLSLWTTLDEQHQLQRKLGITRDEFMTRIFGAMSAGAPTVGAPP